MDKFCSNCGRELKNGKKCEVCTANSNKTVPTDVATTDANVLAIAGFVCALIGFNIIAFVLSILGLNKCKKENANYKGFAIAGIIISSIRFVLTVLFIIIYLLFFIFAVSSDRINEEWNDINSSYSEEYDDYSSTYDHYR